MAELRCRCGAAGADLGDLVAHAVTALDDPDDARPHGWEGEPDRVVQARVARRRREQTRAKVAAAAGVSVAELREALG